MLDILSQTFLFFIYIGIGYLFKKIKLLKKEDSQIFATVIMNLTLPCVFFSSASGIEMNSTLFIFMLIGLFVNIFMIIISFVFSHKDDMLLRGTYMIACSGYDVGNFILPFVTVFFSGLGVIYLCSFNITNTIMSMGMTYAIASTLVHSQYHFNMKQFLKELFSSVSFDVYILIIMIACFHIVIPESLLKVTSSIASVNSFLVMMMIGLKLEFHIQHSEYKKLLYIIIVRFIGAVILSIFIFFLPIPILAKQILTITFFGPLVSVSSVFTKKLGYEGDVVAGANTISIIISMLITTLFIILFQI